MLVNDGLLVNSVTPPPPPRPCGRRASPYGVSCVALLWAEFGQPCAQRSLHSILRDIKRLTFGTGVLHLIQINHQPDATIFSVYYPDVCLQLNMFRAFSRP